MAAPRTRPRARSFLAVAGAIASTVLLAGCDLPSFGLPSATTEQGGRTQTLWQVLFVAAIGVGALIWGLVVFSVIRYRRRRDDDGSMPANQNPYNIPLEIIYTVVPILLVLGIFVGSSIVQQKNDQLSKDPDVTVDVIGYQWQWQFHYEGQGVTVTGDSEVQTPPVMVLPANSTIRFKLRTTDVNHSFWVPKFLTKRDLIPGIKNQIDVTTEGTLDTYPGRCAEYCGLDHWRMNFTVKVVSIEDYRAWVRDQRAAR